MGEAEKPPAVEVFISYSHADEKLRQKLENHLALLRREGFVSVWHDRRIVPGEQWAAEIDAHLESAGIVLLLVSASFIASDYCWDVEVKRAVERHDAGDCRVIPVILSPCDWQSAPFGQIQGLPRDAKPITTWRNRDEAFTDVAKGIRRAVGPHPRPLPETERGRPHPRPLSEAERGASPPSLVGKGDGGLGFTPAQIPLPPLDFTGRGEELAKLLTHIGEQGAAISGLHGMGGVGKTALAQRFAVELAPRCPDGRLMVDLKGTEPQPLTPAGALAQVIRTYAPEARLPDDVATLRGLYHAVLKGRQVLLLLDNARDADQVADFVPPPAGCLLLVTSRHRFHLPGLYALDLDALPLADAVALLLRIAPRLEGVCVDLSPGPSPTRRGEKAPPSPVGKGVGGLGPTARACDILAELCVCLPLALVSAAGTLAERIDLDPAEYITLLRERRERLHPVDASLKLSYDLLPGPLKGRWAALGAFPGHFDRAAAAAVWDCDEDTARSALSELVRRNLVEWGDLSPDPSPTRGGEKSPPSPVGKGVGGLGPARYRLHDLARPVARELLPAGERDETARRHAAHYERVLSAADDLFLQGNEGVLAGLALFDLERGNIEAGQDWAARRAAVDDAAARLCSSYPDAGVYVLSLRQHPREWIQWLEAALTAARRLGDREAEGAHLGNLGLAYARMGEIRRAVEYHEQALVISREIGDRRAEGAHLGNLGNAYADLGEVRRAVEFYEQRLAIAREIGDRRGEGAALGNLGSAYYSLGEVRRAVEFYEQQLAITREIGDRAGEGTALWNMALALDQVGERARAVECAEAALVICEQIEDPWADKVRQKLAEWRGERPDRA